MFCAIKGDCGGSKSTAIIAREKKQIVQEWCRAIPPPTQHLYNAVYCTYRCIRRVPAPFWGVSGRLAKVPRIRMKGLMTRITRNLSSAKKTLALFWSEVASFSLKTDGLRTVLFEPFVEISNQPVSQHH